MEYRRPSIAQQPLPRRIPSVWQKEMRVLKNSGKSFFYSPSA